jgi:hypothetical protein
VESEPRATRLEVAGGSDTVVVAFGSLQRGGKRREGEDDLVSARGRRDDLGFQGLPQMGDRWRGEGKVSWS